MAAERFVLCRRDVGEIGARQYCAKPIKTPNDLNLCDECRARYPFWPGSRPEPVEVAPCLTCEGDDNGHAPGCPSLPAGTGELVGRVVLELQP